MSMFDNNDKDALYDCIVDFLKTHKISELMHIIEVATEDSGDLLHIKETIEDEGAYEQERNGNTEYLKGINYCLNIINKAMKEA